MQSLLPIALFVLGEPILQDWDLIRNTTAFSARLARIAWGQGPRCVFCAQVELIPRQSMLVRRHPARTAQSEVTPAPVEQLCLKHVKPVCLEHLVLVLARPHALIPLVMLI